MCIVEATSRFLESSTLAFRGESVWLGKDRALRSEMRRFPRDRPVWWSLTCWNAIGVQSKRQEPCPMSCDLCKLAALTGFRSFSLGLTTEQTDAIMRLRCRTLTRGLCLGVPATCLLRFHRTDQALRCSCRSESLRCQRRILTFPNTGGLLLQEQLSTSHSDL